MNGIFEQILRADVMVLATPVYFHAMNGPMKTFIDRVCPIYTMVHKSHVQGGANAFLARDDAAGQRILGFYSVSPASIAFDRTPKRITRGLARHEVPGFRLARLAVARSVQGGGLGGQRLLAAGRRCLLTASQTGGVALRIDAKTERVAEWYAGYGAIPRCDAPLSLLLPFKTIHAALLAVGKI